MTSFFKLYKKLLIAIGCFTLVAISFLAVDPLELFPSMGVDRKVLSTLIYSPNSGSSQYQVLKVKLRDSIVIEIYKIFDQFNYQLVSRIDTGNKYEGYFLLGGNATNLAYINIDDDPENEIIVPSFDANLAAHLNVIKFDSNTNTFTLINQKFPQLGPKNF